MQNTQHLLCLDANRCNQSPDPGCVKYGQGRQTRAPVQDPMPCSCTRCGQRPDLVQLCWVMQDGAPAQQQDFSMNSDARWNR